MIITMLESGILIQFSDSIEDDAATAINLYIFTFYRLHLVYIIYVWNTYFLTKAQYLSKVLRLFLFKSIFYGNINAYFY